MPLTTAYLALGSNLGDRLAHLRAALRRLEHGGDLLVVRTSPAYENRAVGMGEADPFLNAVVEVKTRLAPEALLDRCLAVEAEIGRVRSGKWAPRPIDVDLLVFGEATMQTDRLVLPHPRISERDFVVFPLNDLVPELRIQGRTVAAIAAQMSRAELTPIDVAVDAVPPVKMIAALADNRVIGKDGALPWSIPEDWEVFLKKTWGGTLIMGRLTFDEVRKDPDWRRNRRYYILTSQPEKLAAFDVQVVADVGEAIQRARGRGRPVWICGGEAVYTEALPHADQLHLTRIHTEVEGDTVFPQWARIFNQRAASVASADRNYRYTFEVYDR